MLSGIGHKQSDEVLHKAWASDIESVTTSRLKIMLGYAPGVGKTSRLLEEVRRRRKRGQDVVVGALQPDLPPELRPLLNELEIIPVRQIDGGTAIDVDSIIHRRPAVCAIDGLAYDNPPGAAKPTRWQDVQGLLKAGIRVMTSVNIQYIQELQDQIETITGERTAESVPISFIENASEIEVVDATPQEVMKRWPECRMDALQLEKLRELALGVAADIVDDQLRGYLERHGIREHFGTQERVLVCITPRANLPEMIEEAQILTETSGGEWMAAYVRQPGLSAEDQSALDVRIAMARAANGRVEILEGDDPAKVLLGFARSHGITQLFVGRSQRLGPARKTSPLSKLIWQGHGVDVRVFPQ